VVLLAVFVGVGRAVGMGVLMLMVFDRRLALVMARAVRVHVVSTVCMAVLVLCVLFSHDVLQVDCEWLSCVTICVCMQIASRRRTNCPWPQGFSACWPTPHEWVFYTLWR